MAQEHIKLIKEEIINNLKKIVGTLCLEIGTRSYYEIDSLEKAGDYIAQELKNYGYEVSYQPYTFEGRKYNNIISQLKGSQQPETIVILGAHYDTVMGTLGADDNASAIAAMLELARLLRNKDFSKTIRFVAFTLEEPPVFGTSFMGSYVFACSLQKNNENIEGMICLEMIGYFTSEPDSQSYPLPFFSLFYPDRGDFIAFVCNRDSKKFMEKVKTAFKKGTILPVESLAAFSAVLGMSLSDHRSFWEFGYKAFMVTDTAFFRNDNYHRLSDTPDTLDYESMAELVLGLKYALQEILK